MTLHEVARAKVMDAVWEVREYDSYKDGDIYDKADIVEQFINEDYLIYENVCKKAFEEIEDYTVFTALDYITEVYGGHTVKSYEDLYNALLYCYITNEGVIGEILEDMEEEEL